MIMEYQKTTNLVDNTTNQNNRLCRNKIMTHVEHVYLVMVMRTYFLKES